MKNRKLILSIAIVGLGCTAVYLVARERHAVRVVDQAPNSTALSSPNHFPRPATKTSTTLGAQTIAAPLGSLLQAAPSNVVALVNGVAITSAELADELDNLLTSPTAHGALSGQQKDAPRKAALEELIVRELAFQRAKATGMTVGKKEIAAIVKKIKRRYQTEKNFQEALKTEEISEQEFERRIEKDLLLRKISKLELEDKARVSDDEMRRYYEANKARFVLPESLRLFRIVIKIVPGKEAEAKEKADDVYAKLKAGADFGETAYKSSEDDYRVMSGDYGTVHRGQLPADLEATVFAAKPGVLIGPLRNSEGWQLICVENKQTERQLRFSEMREKIRTALYQQREKQRRVKFINELRSVAKIEYLR